MKKQEKTEHCVSDELQQYIEKLIKDTILDGISVEKHRKYLRRYLEAEGVDYSQFEINLSELIETAEELAAQKSKNSECILKMQCKECYLSDDQSEKLISTINKRRNEAEAKRRAEEDAERKAKEEDEAKRRAEEEAERKATEYAKRKAKEAEQRAKEEAERIRKKREDAKREAEEYQVIKKVERLTLIHNGLLCIMVLLISYFEFTTFKKWGWAFVPLLVNIVYTFFRAINVMDCYKEFRKYEFPLSFITFLIINVAAFCFPNAWSLAVLVPIPIISLIVDSAVHERKKEDCMITIHNGLLFTMVLLASYIEFATFDSWGWAFVPLIVNITYSFFRGMMVEEKCKNSFENYEFVLSVVTMLIINIVALCFPNAWSLVVLIPIPIISFIIDDFVRDHVRL